MPGLPRQKIGRRFHRLRSPTPRRWGTRQLRPTRPAGKAFGYRLPYLRAVTPDRSVHEDGQSVTHVSGILCYLSLRNDINDLRGCARPSALLGIGRTVPGPQTNAALLLSHPQSSYCRSQLLPTLEG